MGIFSQSKNSFVFTALFQKKYLLTIDSKMNMGGFLSESKVEVRWQLSLKHIYRDGTLLFELITLDHSMVKTDNSGFIEVHKLVQQLQKALNEITFTIDGGNGKLLDIMNLEAIKARWQNIKSELLTYNYAETSLQDILAIQDNAFESRLGVKGMVQAMEFFDIYMNGIYGKTFPYYVSVQKPNLFRNADIPFELSYSEKQINSEAAEITVTGRCRGLSTPQIKKTYGNFPFLQIDTVKPQFTYNAKYLASTTHGFLYNGEVHYTEEVSDKLGGEVHFKLESYE